MCRTLQNAKLHKTINTHTRSINSYHKQLMELQDTKISLNKQIEKANKETDEVKKKLKKRMETWKNSENSYKQQLKAGEEDKQQLFVRM